MRRCQICLFVCLFVCNCLFVFQVVSLLMLNEEMSDFMSLVEGYHRVFVDTSHTLLDTPESRTGHASQGKILNWFIKSIPLDIVFYHYGAEIPIEEI